MSPHHASQVAAFRLGLAVACPGLGFRFWGLGFKWVTRLMISVDDLSPVHANPKP